MHSLFLSFIALASASSFVAVRQNGIQRLVFHPNTPTRASPSKWEITTNGDWNEEVVCTNSNYRRTDVWTPDWTCKLQRGVSIENAIVICKGAFDHESGETYVYAEGCRVQFQMLPSPIDLWWGVTCLAVIIVAFLVVHLFNGYMRGRKGNHGGDSYSSFETWEPRSVHTSDTDVRRRNTATTSSFYPSTDTSATTAATQSSASFHASSAIESDGNRPPRQVKTRGWADPELLTLKPTQSSASFHASSAIETDDGLDTSPSAPPLPVCAASSSSSSSFSFKASSAIESTPSSSRSIRQEPVSAKSTTKTSKQDTTKSSKSFTATSAIEN